MLNKILYLFLALFFITQWNNAQTSSELFDKGNIAYTNKQYDSAFAFYQKIENQNFYSVALFRNMGSAAYQSNDVPNAIYYFEKALKLSPNDKDLLHNITLAQKKVTDKGVKYKSSGFAAWLSNIIGFTPDFWAKNSVWLCIMGAILLLGYLFVKNNLLRKVGLYLGVFCWTLSSFFVLFAYVEHNHLQSEEFAIIFAPSIDIKNEPSEVSSTVFVLHEGSKVKILEYTSDWHKISFGDDKVGWIQSSELKVI